MNTLIIPGLIWPNPADLKYLALDTPNLNLLIRKSSYNILPYSVADFILTDNATSRAKELNILNKHQHFLLVSPTHLRVDRDRVLICESDLLKLTSDEVSLTIDSLNQHFMNQIRFYKYSDELWLMGLDFSITDNKFYPIINIIGEDINDYLPNHGVHGLKLVNILNEIQMLLFNLDFNHQRKQEGKLTLNSLWLWDHRLVNPKELFTNLNISTVSDINLIKDLYFSACYKDSHAWVDKIHHLDQTLFMSLLNKSNKFNLLIPGIEKTICIIANPIDKYKFWRRNKYLSNFSELF